MTAINLAYRRFLELEGETARKTSTPAPDD